MISDLGSVLDRQKLASDLQKKRKYGAVHSTARTPMMSSKSWAQVARPGNMAITSRQDSRKRVLAGAPVWKKNKIKNRRKWLNLKPQLYNFWLKATK